MPLKCRKCKDTGVLVTWSQPLPFNPQSPPQVKALMQQLKVRIPQKRGENRETTEAKYLRRFAKKHPVFGGILDVRKRNKLLSDYVWEGSPSPYEGLTTVRTTLGFHPSTWRKSSRNPNLQVLPKPTSELHELVLETVVAPPGYLLVQADSEGIEAVLVAYYTGDPRFLKVAKAGPHGFFMAANEGRPISPDLPFSELKRLCKAEKKRDAYLYDRYKRTIHGTHYGLTPYGMHDEYEEEFPTLATAKRMQDAYLGLWPSFVAWAETTRQQAYSQRYLDNNFQYRHYFYNVFSWDGRSNRYVLGEDGKRCIAFKPQSDASAMQTEYLLALAALFPDSLLPWLSLLIHDSFVFIVPRSEALDWVPQQVARVMNMPFAELGGLRIGVELKVGPNLREQSTVAIEQEV